MMHVYLDVITEQRSPFPSRGSYFHSKISIANRSFGSGINLDLRFRISLFRAQTNPSLPVNKPAMPVRFFGTAGQFHTFLSNDALKCAASLFRFSGRFPPLFHHACLFAAFFVNFPGFIQLGLASRLQPLCFEIVEVLVRIGLARDGFDVILRLQRVQDCFVLGF